MQETIALRVKGLEVKYGAIEALKGIDIEVKEGQVVALLGANGAGKTTTLRKISGLIEAEKGSISFYGRDITSMEPEKIAKLGIAQSPEGRQVFRELTVLENLKIGAYTVKDSKIIERNYERVFKYFPVLKERGEQIASTLSGGEQQMLAMGRALMSKPNIILMDEPSMGLSPIYVNEIFDIIKEVSQSGTTVLLVEQNAKKALSIADRAYVLETGRIALEGKASSLLNNEDIKKAYLGE